jgi:hypothetical protein
MAVEGTSHANGRHSYNLGLHRLAGLVLALNGRGTFWTTLSGSISGDFGRLDIDFARNDSPRVGSLLVRLASETISKPRVGWRTC